MKPSGPLSRKTPLASSTPLKRTTALSVSPIARSATHANSAARRREPKRRAAVKPAVPTKIRIALALRSGGVCEMALPGCTRQATDPAHRIRTGMGGRKGEAKVAHDVLSNLIHSCRHCHAWTHAEPDAAGALGLMLRDGSDPLKEPCMYRGTECLIDDDGATTPIELAKEA